jgi:hypothetical protein
MSEAPSAACSPVHKARVKRVSRSDASRSGSPASRKTDATTDATKLRAAVSEVAVLKVGTSQTRPVRRSTRTRTCMRSSELWLPDGRPAAPESPLASRAKAAWSGTALSPVSAGEDPAAPAAQELLKFRTRYLLARDPGALGGPRRVEEVRAQRLERVDTRQHWPSSFGRFGGPPGGTGTSAPAAGCVSLRDSKATGWNLNAPASSGCCAAAPAYPESASSDASVSRRVGRAGPHTGSTGAAAPM